MEFLDGSWKKEVSSWDALMGEELLNQEAILEGAIHSIRKIGRASCRERVYVLV